MSKIQAVGWLVIKPIRSGYSGAVAGVEIDRITKTKPKLGIRDVAIEITLLVDSNLFVQPEPKVTIDLDDRRVLVAPEIQPIIQPDPEEDEEPEPEVPE